MRNPFLTVIDLMSEPEMLFRIVIFELLILFEVVLLTQSFPLFLFQFLFVLIWIYDNAK